MAEDYVNFTAFQVMTGEQAGPVPPQAPSPVPGGVRSPGEGVEDERCGVLGGVNAALCHSLF